MNISTKLKKNHLNQVMTKQRFSIQPLVRVIDDWFTNHPLALLFEVKEVSLAHKSIKTQ